jgi:hypothetical protein
MQKQLVQILNPFFLCMVFFQKTKTHNMMTLMLEFCYEGLRLVNQWVGKGEAQQVQITMTTRYCFHSLIICEYNFLNQGM